MNRKEDGIYALKYASQQMLIEKLRQENARLKELVNHKHKYCSEMEGKYILEKYKLDQLRSWLEENKKKAGTGIFDNFVGWNEVLSKLNELESNKDEKV